MSLDHLWVFLISAAPISELRGGIPTGLFGYDLSWYSVFLVSFLGNLLPVPFILLFLAPLSRLLSRIEIFDRILKWLFERTRQRGRNIERYEGLGLTLFVAVPLPVTGAWTGALIAFLLGMEFKRAFVSIALGVLIAGAIVTSVCLAGWQAYLWLK
jgi:uncharacterized membrane protein